MKIAATLALSMLSLSAIGAQAAGSTDVESVTVRYADLNLDNKSGIAVLYTRIKGAAKSVCRDYAGKTMPQKKLYEACVDLAFSTAVARIDRPMLTDYVAQRSGKRDTATPTQVAVR